MEKYLPLSIQQSISENLAVFLEPH
jgi:hypothetical protein